MEILLICFGIFLVRTITVCMSTFRLLCIVKNRKGAATIIAFVEALIWILILREALTADIAPIAIPIFYSAGFAIGTYIGLILSDRFMTGFFTVNAISTQITDADILKIKNAGFGISFIPMGGSKKLLILQIDKKHFNDVSSILKALDNQIFIMVNETRYVYHGFIK